MDVVGRLARNRRETATPASRVRRAKRTKLAKRGEQAPGRCCVCGEQDVANGRPKARAAAGTARFQAGNHGNVQVLCYITDGEGEGLKKYSNKKQESF